jgi:hypothetical protein
MKLGYKKTPEAIVVGQLDPNYTIAETLDLNLYDDVSTIEGWYGSNVLDWGRRRLQIKPLFYAKAGADLSNFATLTDAEKQIGAECFFIPLVMRLQFWSSDEDKVHWGNLLARTKESRVATIETMRKRVGDRIRTGELTLLQTQMFDKDSSAMISWYERSDARDFYQWLTNEVGSAYETDGFAEKTYYSQALKDELLTIYNGLF